MERYESIFTAKAAEMNPVELRAAVAEGLDLLNAAVSRGVLEDKALRLILITVASLFVEMAVKDVSNFKRGEQLFGDDPELAEIKKTLGV